MADGGGPCEVSIIVCTLDRASRLDGCLRHLSELRVPACVRAEVVVVDNGSRDDTALVVEDWRLRSRLPVRYVHEPRPGTGHGRNRGLELARGELIASVDDDCRVAPDWLEQLWAEFEANPEAGIIGGRVELFDPRDRPITIKATRHRQHLTDASGLDGFVHGCNLAFRREVITTVGPYDARFGAGAPLPAGEDAELVYRAFRSGWHVMYSPAFVVHHDHGRRTEAAEEALMRLYRIGTGALRMKHILAGDRAMARASARDLRRRLREALAGWRSPAAAWRRLRPVAHLLHGAVLYGLTRQRMV